MKKNIYLRRLIVGVCLLAVVAAWRPHLAIAQQPSSPPTREKYFHVNPAPQISNGQPLLPATFIKNQLGVSINTIDTSHWKLSWFGSDIQMTLGSKIAQSDKNISMTNAPAIINGQPYFPWDGLAKAWDWNGELIDSPAQGKLLLVRYQAAYLKEIRHSTSADTFRAVYELSNPTLIKAQNTSNGPEFSLAASRLGGSAAIPSQITTGDALAKQLSVTSGDWNATLKVLLAYQAPVKWFTLADPPRIVVDIQRSFEESSTKTTSPGLTYQRIRRGLQRGPVVLHVVRADPSAGWRISVANGGYSVLRRNVVSKIANSNRATVAINGGFFAYNGAAVGAVKSQGEWMRLPWPNRSVIGGASDGSAKIGRINLSASVAFGSGQTHRITNLNGFLHQGISVITRHYATSYTLKPGQMALVVKNGVVTSRPGGGEIQIPEDTFLLVGSGNTAEALKAIQRGTSATLQFSAPGWEQYSNILGAGPQIVRNGQVHVSNEGFRSDVTRGAGPRTAVGIDKKGNYIFLVADGRKPGYSVGLTLNELGATMQSLGAVDAINFDGGGSTTMTVNGKVVNTPSDGRERSVANIMMIKKP